MPAAAAFAAGGGLAAAAARCGGRCRRPARARRRRPFATRAAGDGGLVNVSLGEATAGPSALLALKTGELKRQLRVRGLDTTTCFDRDCLLEQGARAGLLPPDAASFSNGIGNGVGRELTSELPSAAARARARALRRALRSGPPPAPVNVALRRVPAQGQYLPSGLFTDGERLALPLWNEEELDAEPLWFVLDTAIRRTALSRSCARRLGVPASGGAARGLRLAGEAVGELAVQVVPDGSAVLGEGVAGLLGPDFLYGWDLDLDIPRCRAAAWPAGDQLVPGFGPREALEIEVQGSQGLLEVQAQLTGTVEISAANGAKNVGRPLRAVVDLGQTFSACNWAAARQLGLSGRDALGVRPAGQWLDLDGRPIEVCEADLDVVISGRASGVLQGVRVCEGRLFWIAETLPILERLGFNPAEPCALLGLDTVGRSRIALSARHRRLWLPV